MRVLDLSIEHIKSSQIVIGTIRKIKIVSVAAGWTVPSTQLDQWWPMSTLHLRHASRKSKTPRRARPLLDTMEPASSTAGATAAAAALYVLSGATQPLLMPIVENAGLADPSCQLYMLFYALGPALVSLSLVRSSRGPTISMVGKAATIAVVDIVAQTANYTGASMAGPTIFAIIYSSVTIWTAVFSRVLIFRQMNMGQWAGVTIVFLGLTITAVDSVEVGPKVFRGSCLVLAGSALHALTYVMNEMVMTKGEKLDPKINCSVQGLVGTTAFLTWQIFYTRQHFEVLIQDPMNAAGTSFARAALILLSISVSNLIHALAYFYTLKLFPGGATSAGIMKGLQAVLVFIFTSLVFCGRTGGSEMCFSGVKLFSLGTVIFGILMYAKATERQIEEGQEGIKKGGGYSRIQEA